MKYVFQLLCLLGASLIALQPSQSILADEINHDHFIIHSIPKCGTHCLERAITLLTDKLVLSGGYSPELLDQAEQLNKIVRIHQAYDKPIVKALKKRNYKIISMSRDPRDALVSVLFFMRRLKDRGLQRDFFKVSADFDTMSLDEQLAALITGTHDMQSYLEYYQNRAGWILDNYSLGIKYEDLVGSEGGGDNRIQQNAIIKIANYIHMPLSDEKLNFVVSNLYQKIGRDAEQDGKVYMRSEVGNWKTFFNAEHKKMFKQRCGKLLIKLGYEKDLNW